MKSVRKRRSPEETREELVQATVRLILRQGFAATRVDEICAEAGVTKGAFFHHFQSKEDVGEAAIQWWADMGRRVYAPAWDDEETDALDRLFLMLDIMEGFAKNEDPCCCVLGMMSQECSQTHPGYRELCDTELDFWSGQVADLLEQAKASHEVTGEFEPKVVARFLNSLWQGSMLLAKTHREKAIILDNLAIARTYIKSLFH